MKTIKKKINAVSFISALFILISLTGCSKPGDATVQNAMKAYSSKNYDKALEFFNQALNEETNYSPELIYTFISNVYAAQDDMEMSSFYLEKALERKPDYRGYVTLGMNYQSTGDYEKALENYDKAVSLNPDKGEAYASSGTVFLETGRIDEAVSYLEKAALLEPNIAVIHAELAVAYAMAGQFDKSDEELLSAETLKCTNIEQFREKILNIKNSD